MAVIETEEAAKRLARVIVSDIELYNREKFRAGADLSHAIQEGLALFRSRVAPGLVSLFDTVLADKRAAAKAAPAQAAVPSASAWSSPAPAPVAASPASAPAPVPVPLPEMVAAMSAPVFAAPPPRQSVESQDTPPPARVAPEAPAMPASAAPVELTVPVEPAAAPPVAVAVASVSPRSGLVDTEEGAARLSRVIISDIELYNAKKIASGGDLTAEIAEGRALFKKRVVPELAALFEATLANKGLGDRRRPAAPAVAKPAAAPAPRPEPPVAPRAEVIAAPVTMPIPAPVLQPVEAVAPPPPVRSAPPARAEATPPPIPVAVRPPASLADEETTPVPSASTPIPMASPPALHGFDEDELTPVPVTVRVEAPRFDPVELPAPSLPAPSLPAPYDEEEELTPAPSPQQELPLSASSPSSPSWPALPAPSFAAPPPAAPSHAGVSSARTPTPAPIRRDSSGAHSRPIALAPERSGRVIEAPPMAALVPAAPAPALVSTDPPTGTDLGLRPKLSKVRVVVTAVVVAGAVALLYRFVGR